MKTVLIPAVAVAMVAVVSSSAPAPAKGCLKGAVIGGVAGHYLGHHGWLGAGARCIIGHHEAVEHARERERAYHGGYGSSAHPRTVTTARLGDGSAAAMRRAQIETL